MNFMHLGNILNHLKLVTKRANRTSHFAIFTQNYIATFFFVFTTCSVLNNSMLMFYKHHAHTVMLIHYILLMLLIRWWVDTFSSSNGYNSFFFEYQLFQCVYLLRLFIMTWVHMHYIYTYINNMDENLCEKCEWYSVWSFFPTSFWLFIV